jgi:UDP-N-acetylglucosamine 1-carboxyvinyltransferase
VEKRPINRFIDTWKSLGFIVTETEDFVGIEAGTIAGANVNFKISTHSGTDNAIISSVFAQGETVINNAAEEAEIEDLVNFINLIGGNVKRVEPRVLKINGKNIFKGGKFEIQPDKNEAVLFAVAAVVTGGNISIEGIDKSHLTSFVNTLTKIGCKYEFSGDEMRVWSSGEKLLPVEITTAPAPGFMTDWQPATSLLLTVAEGVSSIYDTVYSNRFGYIKDLNRMGAKIDLLTPSQAGLAMKLSDDSYDLQKLGEPFTVAKITGPTKLKGVKLDVWDLNSGPALLLATLCAEGRSEVGSMHRIEGFYENFVERLIGLGAKIFKTE